MIWSNIAVGVWRRTTAEAVGCASALKGQQRSPHLWSRPGKSLHQPSQKRRGRGDRWGCAASARIARENSLFELLFCRDRRKVSHIRGGPHGTDHLHNVWFLCAGGVLACSAPIVLLGLLSAVSLGEQRHSDAE